MKRTLFGISVAFLLIGGMGTMGCDDSAGNKDKNSQNNNGDQGNAGQQDALYLYLPVKATICASDCSVDEPVCTEASANNKPKSFDDREYIILESDDDEYAEALERCKQSFGTNVPESDIVILKDLTESISFCSRKCKKDAELSYCFMGNTQVDVLCMEYVKPQDNSGSGTGTENGGGNGTGNENGGGNGTGNENGNENGNGSGTGNENGNEQQDDTLHIYMPVESVSCQTACSADSSSCDAASGTPVSLSDKDYLIVDKADYPDSFTLCKSSLGEGISDDDIVLLRDINNETGVYCTLKCKSGDENRSVCNPNKLQLNVECREYEDPLTRKPTVYAMVPIQEEVCNDSCERNACETSGEAFEYEASDYRQFTPGIIVAEFGTEVVDLTEECGPDAYMGFNTKTFAIGCYNKCHPEDVGGTTITGCGILRRTLQHSQCQEIESVTVERIRLAVDALSNEQKQTGKRPKAVGGQCVNAAVDIKISYYDYQGLIFPVPEQCMDSQHCYELQTLGDDDDNFVACAGSDQFCTQPDTEIQTTCSEVESVSLEVMNTCYAPKSGSKYTDNISVAREYTCKNACDGNGRICDEQGYVD